MSFQDIPIVVVGNKQDVVREIEPGDVQDWAQNFLPQERYKRRYSHLSDNHGGWNKRGGVQKLQNQ